MDAESARCATATASGESGSLGPTSLPAGPPPPSTAPLPVSVTLPIARPATLQALLQRSATEGATKAAKAAKRVGPPPAAPAPYAPAPRPAAIPAASVPVVSKSVSAVAVAASKPPSLTASASMAAEAAAVMDFSVVAPDLSATRLRVAQLLRYVGLIPIPKVMTPELLGAQAIASDTLCDS